MALCMRPVVTYVSTRYNVKRIACMRCGLQKALKKEQRAAGSSNKASRDDDIISSTHCKTATTDGYAEQDRDLVGPVPSCVDIVVINDITELQQQDSDLIASAERRLCPDGILMIALPVRNTLETARLPDRGLEPPIQFSWLS